MDVDRIADIKEAHDYEIDEIDLAILLEDGNIEHKDYVALMGIIESQQKKELNNGY